jgi:hypothetical protein
MPIFLAARCFACNKKFNLRIIAKAKAQENQMIPALFSCCRGTKSWFYCQIAAFLSHKVYSLS